MHLKAFDIEDVKKMEMHVLHHVEEDYEEGNKIPDQYFLLTYSLMQDPRVTEGEIRNRLNIGSKQMDKLILCFVVTCDPKILFEPFFYKYAIDKTKIISMYDPPRKLGP